MPKPPLRAPYNQLSADIIETLIAGHKRYRHDLPYPESHSDMEAAVEALLSMFEVKRRPIAMALNEMYEPAERLPDRKFPLQMRDTPG